VGLTAFSTSFRGLELVPAKWHCLVPGERRDGAQSRPPALITLARALRRGANAIPLGTPAKNAGAGEHLGDAAQTQAIGRPYINRTIITQGKSNQIA